MFCIKCGYELKDNYKVCPRCGYAVSNPSKPSEKPKTNKDSMLVSFIMGIILGIVLIIFDFQILGTACIIESILLPIVSKLGKPLLLLTEGIILVCVCVAIFNKYNNQTNDISVYEDDSDVFVEEQSDYTETEDELNLPGENQIEYHMNDTNEMMWEDLDYYADIYDNFASSQTASETQEAEDFYANEDNLWFEPKEGEYDYRKWYATDGREATITTSSPPTEGNAHRLIIDYPDRCSTAIDFNPLPAKIAPTGEMIYYFDFAGDFICMTYFPEDDHIHIESGKDHYRGDYYMQ